MVMRFPFLDVVALSALPVMLHSSRSPSPTCCVDASEHLKVLVELTDCKEKYYRLGADLRQLKLRALETAAKTSHKNSMGEDNQQQQQQQDLGDALGRHETLRHEFAQFRRDSERRERLAQARMDALVQDLEMAKAYVDKIEQAKISDDTVQLLRRQLRDKSNDMDVVVEENQVLREDLDRERARRKEIERDCDKCRTRVQELQIELAAHKHRHRRINDDGDNDDEEATTGVLSQLIADNKRLSALLMDTAEFARFRMHETLVGASYVERPPQDNLDAWGRLVSELLPRYLAPKNAVTHPTTLKSRSEPTSSGMDEELRWVPSHVLHLVRSFQRRHCPTVSPHLFVSWGRYMGAPVAQRVARPMYHQTPPRHRTASQTRSRIASPVAAHDALRYNIVNVCCLRMLVCCGCSNHNVSNIFSQV
ncbi:hypothetical protein, variant 1, partial [Aphanomyces astaci]